MSTNRVTWLTCCATAALALPAMAQEFVTAANIQAGGRNVKVIPMSDDAKTASANMVFVPTDDNGWNEPVSPASSQLAERLRRSNHTALPASVKSENTQNGVQSGCDNALATAVAARRAARWIAVPPEFWEHRSGIFADFLYLHASGVDMAHAISQNGTGGPGTTPNGRVGVVDQQYEPGFRFGFEKALNSCTSVIATYTRVDSHATDSLEQQAGVGSNVASLVLHPNSVNAGSTSTLIDATYDIDFQTVDVELNQLLAGGCNNVVNYTVGVRYGNLQQQFTQTGSFAPPAGVIHTATDIDFNGGGLRLGLDGRRRIGCGGLSFYGKGFINVLFGEFSSSYTQTNTTTSVIQAYSTWDDDRCVPVLEYELGLSWQNCSGCLRMSCGYYTAFWFNAITTPEYVQAVQNANFVNLGDTIASDGLTTRVEYRF